MTAQPHAPDNGLNPLAAFTLEIETQRRQLDMAMSIVDACRLANDSALVPMYAPPDPQEDDAAAETEDEDTDNDKENEGNRLFPPEADLEGALAMVWIILNGVSAQLEKLVFKTFEDAVAARRTAAGAEDPEDRGIESATEP